MDKKIAGLLGAMTALGTASPSLAAPAPQPDPMAAGSYADLLKPIPNASALLAASDAAARVGASVDGEATLQKAQFYYNQHHHHHNFYRGEGFRPRFFGGPVYHHHHHGYYRRFYNYHHHHHFRGYGY